MDKTCTIHRGHVSKRADGLGRRYLGLAVTRTGNPWSEGKQPREHYRRDDEGMTESEPDDQDEALSRSSTGKASATKPGGVPHGRNIILPASKHRRHVAGQGGFSVTDRAGVMARDGPGRGKGSMALSSEEIQEALPPYSLRPARIVRCGTEAWRSNRCASSSRCQRSRRGW